MDRNLLFCKQSLDVYRYVKAGIGNFVRRNFRALFMMKPWQQTFEIEGCHGSSIYSRLYLTLVHIWVSILWSMDLEALPGYKFLKKLHVWHQSRMSKIKFPFSSSSCEILFCTFYKQDFAENRKLELQLPVRYSPTKCVRILSIKPCLGYVLPAPAIYPQTKRHIERKMSKRS